jgi:cell division protease FtsH
VGAARVRDLCEQARQAAPSIIFIDELDALGRARGSGMLGGHDEKEQTLNQLLSELDGFDPGTGIVLLAATNRPEILDPALLRAGRFDRQVLVDRPDRIGRAQILAVHVRKVKLGAGIDLDGVAALTPGFTGADLANLVNEAALLATRRDAEAVTMDDFTGAIERIVAGIEKHSRVMSADERRAVAYHEMGHALVASSLPGMDPVHKVSIIPRGIGALGYTIQRPTEDRFLMSRQNLKDKMAVLMGGRASEALVLGETSTGAADDLDKVTEIARHMTMRYGMDERVGQVVYDEAHSQFLGDGARRRGLRARHAHPRRSPRGPRGRRPAAARKGDAQRERTPVRGRPARGLRAERTLGGPPILSPGRRLGAAQAAACADEGSATSGPGPREGRAAAGARPGLRAAEVPAQAGSSSTASPVRTRPGVTTSA